MGMHIGLIAVKASVAKFRDAFSRTWPQFETIASAGNFPDANAIWAWKESHEEFASAANWSKDNPGKGVYVFWPDGPWTIMMDPDYTLATDEEGLQRLSVQVGAGAVLSFVVESAGGSAFFWCAKDGKILRKIINSDTDVSTEGNPLPEEKGIDISNYYMDETESLWKAFGLSPYKVMSSSKGCEVICVIDNTDYGAP
jgi:hypothetical protein